MINEFKMDDIEKKLKNLQFLLDSSDKKQFSELSNEKFIIYFYPKDDTPGCTKEAIAFNANKQIIENLGFKIFGVSKDNIEKHNKFKTKYDLDFPLISDEGGEICNIFKVWVEKSMYGKKYMGIERSTFIFDKNFKILKVWRKVKVNGHVDEIIDFLKSLE